MPPITNNGTAFANTTAVKTLTGCQTIPVREPLRLSGGYSRRLQCSGSNDATGRWRIELFCSFQWLFDHLERLSHHRCSIWWTHLDRWWFLPFLTPFIGADVLTCDANLRTPQFNPVGFWFFKGDPSQESKVKTSVNIISPRYTSSAMASATFCFPSVSIWEVNVGVDIRTGNVTDVTEIRPSQHPSFSLNVTDTPLNGSSYNGIGFDLTNPDELVLGRQNAIQVQLATVIYREAIRSPEGYVGTFANGRFSTLTDKVYVGTFWSQATPRPVVTSSILP